MLHALLVVWRALLHIHMQCYDLCRMGIGTYLVLCFTLLHFTSLRLLNCFHCSGFPSIFRVHPTPPSSRCVPHVSYHAVCLGWQVSSSIPQNTKIIHRGRHSVHHFTRRQRIRVHLQCEETRDSPWHSQDFSSTINAVSLSSLWIIVHSACSHVWYYSNSNLTTVIHTLRRLLSTITTWKE